MTQLVLIDENPKRSNTIAESLAAFGLTIRVETQLEALLAVNDDQCDCIIISQGILDDQPTGLAQLADIAPCVVIAAQASVKRAVDSMRDGAVDYLDWPLASEELLAAIERATAYSVRASSDRLSQFPLIGESSAMQMLRESIGKVGPTDSSVLIFGASGTGKELVARAVHASSTRANAPLMSINCATIPANLVEAELFGAAQLSDDSQLTAGLVAAANGGTLFLDEIAELPESAQAKLLQVLLGTHRRLGEAASAPVDIRVIASTHRNLDQLVKNGQFRQDLFYRLNVVSLELPPLNSRQDDALLIAEWLLERTGKRLNKSGQSFAPDAIAAIRAYHWPGNIRELENAVERAVILADSNNAIGQAHLAIEPQADNNTNAKPTTPGDLTSLEDYFVKFVQQHQDQLTETELAEKLGISRKSLWERRQRLNIPRRKTKKRGPRQDSAAK